MLQRRCVVWDRKDAVRTTGLVHIATRRRLGQETDTESKEVGKGVGRMRHALKPVRAARRLLGTGNTRR